MEEDVTRGAGLENLAVHGEMIEFSERDVSVTSHPTVQYDRAGFDQLPGRFSTMFGAL